MPTGPTPLDVPPGRYTAIDVGVDHACAITEDGAVVCWGDNERGQTDAPARPLYVNLSEQRAELRLVRGRRGDLLGRDLEGVREVPPGAYSAIVVSNWEACALTEDGAVP